MEVFNESEFPVEWAASQWALGNYYEQTAEGEADRRRAIPHLQAAQRVWAREKAPHFWAATEMNLGQVYLDLPSSSGNLKRAVTHLERALEGYKKANQPHQWALTQMMLSKAHSLMANLAGKDKNLRSRHMRRAIASQQAAAHVFAQIKEPENVAFALASEGLLWGELPTGNRREHLRQSANCFLKSADQLHQAGDGEQRALQLEIAATILMKLAELTKSSKEVQEALQTYQAAHEAFIEVSDFASAERAKQMVRQLHALLQKAQHEANS